MLDNSNINVHLGKASKYESTYNPKLLVREPRVNNRKYLNIDDDNLPFYGVDVWNAYEVSWLLENGLPATAIAKIVYPCNSKYIVESKSIKLYLNSFNMTSLGATYKESCKRFVETVQKDLIDLLQTTAVDVHVHTTPVSNDQNSYSLIKDLRQRTGGITWDIQTIEQVYPVEQAVFGQYTEDPTLLIPVDKVSNVCYHSTLLKSNCRVTSQPDWGDVFIHIDGPKTVDPVSLAKYLVSFRDENHFHEEICECIYKRLYDLLQPDELTVACMYVRRGGIDINPIRSSVPTVIGGLFTDAQMKWVKQPRQ